MAIYADDALEGETALVTGATGGIGSVTAEVIAGMGADVVITGRDEEALATVGREVAAVSTAGDVHAHPTDITEEADRRALLEAAEETCGPVSVLVNSAGTHSGRRPFEEVTAEEFAGVMDVNTTATLFLTQEVYEGMKSRGEGAIVNVSSLSGLRGTYRSIPYCASKFALTGITQSLSLEAIEHGVRVNAVCPGWVDTEMAHDGIRSKADAKGRSYEEQLERERASIPSGRITTPEEVANAIAFLATDAASNVVGESVKLSGGTVLR